MALILLASALLLGAAAVRRLRLPVYPFEFVALAVVLGLFGWTWLAFLACLVLPYAIAVPAAVLVAVAASVVLIRPEGRRPLRWRTLEGGRPGWILWGVATAGTVAVLGRLFWTHSLVSDSTGVYTAGSTWADFGLHAAIISHLAEPSSMPHDLPVASGTHLTYPFLVDLLSALLVRGGWGLHLSLFVPGVLLALACCQLLLSVSLRLFGHVGAAVAGLGLVLTTGTAAGTRLAWSDWQHSGKGLGEFLRHLPRDYTVLSERNGNVTNLVANAMLPQRSILFGLGVGLTVFVLLHAGREAGDRRLLLVGAGLIGLLPMAHPHTFMVCMALLAALTLERAVLDRRPPVGHLLAIGLALAAAAPQLAWQQLANPGGTGGRFRFGWMRRDGESLLHFWGTNFGLMGVFFLALPFLLARPALRTYLVWYLPCLGVLAVTQVYAFQPFEYDNLKLLYWVYVVAGLFAGFLAVRLFQALPWTLAPLAVAGLVVALPGALSITREFELRDQFASADDVRLADWIRQSTAPTDVFLSTDRPNNPVSSLGGRTIVMGYRGWLYNFNIPYADREAAIRAGLAGRLDDPAVRRFDAAYLAVQTREGDEWSVDRTALAAAPRVYENAGWTVYRLPAAGGGAGSARGATGRVP